MTTYIKASTINKNNVALVLVVDGKYRPYSVDSTHPSFNKIVKQVNQGVAEGLEDLINVSTAITKWADNATAPDAEGRVTVSGGVVRYAGKSIHNSLTKRILSMIAAGDDASALIKFLENVQCNPSQTSREELFDFLDGNMLPLTKEGKFLAYKKVSEDYRDLHTRSMDNSVGKVVEMDRDKVDAVRENTCSRGLHFASLGYARDFYSSGGRMVVLEIDPADVVSIPVDYGRQKGRTWKYKVVGEIDLATLKNNDVLEKKTVVDLSQQKQGENFEAFLARKASNQRRDAKGRFIK